MSLMSLGRGPSRLNSAWAAPAAWLSHSDVPVASVSLISHSGAPSSRVTFTRKMIFFLPLSELLTWNGQVVTAPAAMMLGAFSPLREMEPAPCVWGISVWLSSSVIRYTPAMKLTLAEHSRQVLPY